MKDDCKNNDIAQRMEVNFNSDSNGNVSPQIALPYSWNEHFFSVIAYNSGTTTSIEEDSLNTVNNPSKFASISSQNVLSLTILSYQSNDSFIGYAFGFGGQYRDIKNNEFGYFNLNNAQTSFDTINTIEQYDATLNLEVYKKDIFKLIDFRLSALLSAFSSMSVEHRGSYTNIPDAKESSNYAQDINYAITADMYINASEYFKIALSSTYSYLPLKYDISVPNFNDNTHSVATIESKERITRGDVKILISAIEVGGMNPSFGAGYELVQKTINGDSQSDVNNKLVLFGFEKKF